MRDPCFGIGAVLGELVNALAFWFTTAFIALALALLLTIGQIMQEMIRERY